MMKNRMETMDNSRNGNMKELMEQGAYGVDYRAYGAKTNYTTMERGQRELSDSLTMTFKKGKLLWSDLNKGSLNIPLYFHIYVQPSNEAT